MTAVTPVDAGSLDDGAIALDAVLQQVGELLRGSANRRVAVGIEMLNHLRFADRLRHLALRRATTGCGRASRSYSESSDPD
jgi:hypothetical protein